MEVIELPSPITMQLAGSSPFAQLLDLVSAVLPVQELPSSVASVLELKSTIYLE